MIDKKIVHTSVHQNRCVLKDLTLTHSSHAIVDKLELYVKYYLISYIGIVEYIQGNPITISLSFLLYPEDACREKNSFPNHTCLFC